MIELALGDIFDLQQGFAFKSKDFLSQGVPILKIKNVKSSGLSFHQLDYVEEGFLDTHGKYIPDHGDALISMSGNRLNGSKETWVGKVALYSEDQPYLINQRVGILKNKNSKEADTAFIVYSLSSDYWQLRFAQTATSSGGQANLSTSQILSERVLLPTLSEQKSIAHILGTLDDKIELNQEMNQTLEEMAKAIFKSWFVDFDPVRAKAEGRPTGLPPEISDLFPDELVDSEIGKIPKGWEVTIVSGFGNVVCGKTPSTKDPDNFGGRFPFITIPDMRGNLISLSTDRSVSEKGASALKGKMLPAGSICVSCIATPGLVSITNRESFTNQQINSIVPLNDGDREYLLFSMMTFGDLISSAGSGGSVFANLSTGRFKELPILQATEQIRTAFSKIIRPMLQRIELSQQEISTLSQLRDTLLPKLISGELRVPDAEKFLEEAGI